MLDDAFLYIIRDKLVCIMFYLYHYIMWVTACLLLSHAPIYVPYTCHSSICSHLYSRLHNDKLRSQRHERKEIKKRGKCYQRKQAKQCDNVRSEFTSLFSEKMSSKAFLNIDQSCWSNINSWSISTQKSGTTTIHGIHLLPSHFTIVNVILNQNTSMHPAHSKAYTLDHPFHDISKKTTTLLRPLSLKHLLTPIFMFISNPSYIHVIETPRFL